MSIDPELVRQLSNRSRREEQSVKNLVYGLHRTSPWNELISLESAVLPPVPTIKNNRWSLHALLALPVRAERTVTGYYAPWGMVSWSWPERTVTQVIDLRMQDTSNEIAWQKGSIPNIPAGEKSMLGFETQVQREDALFRTLDGLLATSPSNGVDLRPLAGLYSGLLPAEVYPYYWAQIPSSRDWLRPDVPPKDHPFHAGTEVTENIAPVVLPESASVSQGLTDSSPEPSSTSSVRPTDLSPWIANWLQRAIELAQSCQTQEIVARLQELENRLRYPGFRLAFIGEFNRGKSTLINLLLERPLLPVGAVPTTTAVTSILAGNEDGMEVLFPDGHKEQHLLTESSWSDVLTTGDQSTQPGAFPRIRITLQHPWLRDLDAEIIDTPGVNDPYGPRNALTTDILSNSDAAVLLIAAFSPVSQTEAIFLEQEVIGRHVPHIIVVVSMLDKIEPEQRELVMNDVREKIAAISPRIPVVATQPTSNGKTSVQVLEEVRNQITELAAQADRRAWRSRQIAGMIADYTQQLEELCQVALSTARLDVEKRAEALQNLQEDARRGALEWELIKLELKKRATHLEQVLQQRLDSLKERILDSVLFDLSKTNDPKIWWEQDFPFRLRQHFLGLVREAETFVLTTLGQDMQWLQQRVQKTFHIALSNTSPQLDAPRDVTLEQMEMSLADINRLRLFSRVGSGAATVIGYLLLGPIGSAISIAGGIISEQSLRTRIKEQQQLLETEARISVERSIQEYFARVSDRLEEFYSHMLDELQRQQSTWEASKTRILQAGTAVNEQPHWQRAIDSATTLRQEIEAELIRQ